jgi:uncharacterized protein
MTTQPIRETNAMISKMAPKIMQDRYVFCNTGDSAMQAKCLQGALGMFVETEGMSFILSEERARDFGFDTSMPMRCITLEVHSALDGVGLTAAVATELAKQDIPCNMVAAFHHDHVFVPDAQAEAALITLQNLQNRL